MLEMSDGNDWAIPLVSFWDAADERRRSLLPPCYDIDENGRLTNGDMLEVHRWLWEATQPAWDAMVAGEGVSMQMMLPVFGALIQANYYAGAFELGMLKALSPEINPLGIVSLAIGWTTWQEWAAQKKTEEPSPPQPAGFPIALGNGEGSPVIVPTAPIS
jgi:hypothetical protein